MSTDDVILDPSGARASNAGDEYHELWAVRQALLLLDQHNDLTGMTVEGLRAEDGVGRNWDGVDCALFFGGDSSSEAARVELQQLKYSSAHPTSSWTVARFSTGRGGKVASSPIRKLADAHKALLAKRQSKGTSAISVAFVTNQPIDPELISLIESARVKTPGPYKRAWKKGGDDLHRLVHASGLRPRAFRVFAQALDLRGQSGSRFAIEETVLASVAAWSDHEFIEATRRLRDYVRTRMLPESAGDFITREKVLVQFRITDPATLFPCPSQFTFARNPVPRAPAERALKRMREGQQRICLHGGGGVGKTTALQEICAGLPPGSVSVLFDCYGGGSYLDASALRHKPEDAFLQLSNDLASQLRVPLLLETHSTRDFARAFHKRLCAGAALLASTQPDAILLIAIDAADNSVTAAGQRLPPDKSFVHDIVTFSDLPANVRLLITARTGRRKELRLDSSFAQIELDPFSAEETRANVARYWAAPANWIDDFHHLSEGVPRVQAYAFESAPEAPEHAIEALRPVGKKLSQVFDEQFKLALSKSGRAVDLHLVCAGLTALARPIPLAELAAVLRFDTASVADMCADLAPGVRRRDDHISFADEDFEAYVRDAAAECIGDVQQRTADRFLQRALTDAYAAANVVPALFAARRGKELLDFVEQSPEPEASLVADPVRRREIQLQRLVTAIRVCREAGAPSRALRFVLIGAEAIGTESATRALLAGFPELAARYAKETSSRLILGDPERIEEHGPLLFQMLAEDAAQGDAIAFREEWRRIEAWDEARLDAYRSAQAKNEHARGWPVTTRDGAAVLYADLLHKGPLAGVGRFWRLRRWGWRFALGSLCALTERLLAERRFDALAAFAEKMPDAWALFVLTPSAMIGQAIDYGRLARGLAVFARRSTLSVEIMGHSVSRDAMEPIVVDTVLSATEILASKATGAATVDAVLACFLGRKARRIDLRHDFETNHLDAILRAYWLSETRAGKEGDVRDILLPRPTPPDPDPSEKESARRERARHEKERDDRVSRLVSAMAPLYRARAQALISPADGVGAKIGAALHKFNGDAWQFDRRSGSSGLRAKLAENMTVLLAAGVAPAVVLEQALAVRGHLWSDGDNGIARLITRLSGVVELHSALLGTVIKAAAKTRELRAGAEEKSGGLARYAVLLAPISRPDSDALFKQAIEVASELDSEAMDQIRFLGALLSVGASAIADRATLAADLSDIIQDASIRLEHVEHFPWDEGVGALARLNFSAALAAASRWDDLSTAPLDKTLPAVTAAGIASGAITPSQALAILGVLERGSASDLDAVMTGEGGSADIAEELAHDLVTDRIVGGKKLGSFVRGHGQGIWSRQLEAQATFKTAIGISTAESENVSHREPDEEALAVLTRFLWSDAILTNAELLSTALETLKAELRAAKGYFLITDILEHARKQVSVGARPAHLDALVGLFGRQSERYVFEAIRFAIKDWREQPAIADWAQNNLPDIIASHLSVFQIDMPWDTGSLEESLELASDIDDVAQRTLLEGIQRCGDELGVTATFTIAGMVAVKLEPVDAAELSAWYIARLQRRIKAEDCERIASKDIPNSSEGAIARFILAALSDVDVRHRWRAAHSVRRLARLGEHKVLSNLVLEHDRRDEPAFRNPNAPFYWIAARLWLVIALGRIAYETPTAAAPHGAWLLAVARDQDFPHLLIRAYAKDACGALHGSGLLALSKKAAKELAGVNKSALTRGVKKLDYRQSFNGPGGRDDERPRRFRFDGLDTLRYWYEPWLRAFEGLTTEHFLETAEHWIVDRWGYSGGAEDREEPRKVRFSDRDWTLSSNGHGSLPTLEYYSSHLEWHAMWCAAGDILKTHRIAKREYDDTPPDDDPVADQIGYDMPSDEGLWVSDLVQGRPLEPRRWRDVVADVDEGVDISDDEFLPELIAPSRPGFLVVDAYIDDNRSGIRETVRVHTAKVSPAAAPALLRALQTVDNNFDYYLCPEGDEREIRDPEYSLLGWLTDREGDAGFDRKDPFSNGLRRLETTPGERVAALLRLNRAVTPQGVQWTQVDTGAVCFVYEAWGARERDERYHRGDPERGSRGHRLLVSVDALAEFLEADGFDLMVNIGVSRRGEKSDAFVDDEEDAPRESKEGEFDRVFLLRADGRIEAAERSVGTWREDCSRA